MDLRELIKDYLDYLEIEKNRSIKTRLNYERYLNKFLTFSKIAKPSGISQELVRKYRLWLNRQPVRQAQGESGPAGNIKKSTQNYYLIALRNFLKYLAKRDIQTLSADKIELGKQEERHIEFLEPHELDRLLASPEGNSFKIARDRAILETLFATGLRVSELCGLDRDSINLKSGEFSIRGKGGKIRLVFLSDPARQALKIYLEKRDDTNHALFIRFTPYHAESPARKGDDERSSTVAKRNPLKPHLEGRGTGFTKNPNKQENLRLTPRSVERLVKYYAVKAGLAKKVTAHTLRHSFATDLLANGADLRSVQELLGHSSITTTQIYTHVTNKQLKEVHRVFHGKQRR